MVRHLDLFSGIGGFALAARMVGGIETVAFCEREPYAQRVLRKHWPNVPICDDIHKLKGTDYETIDLITGGFPCQPYSCAGQRRGNADDRALWPQMLRVIRETRPRWVLGENVPGIIALALDGVLADLEAEGYTCEAFCIPACAVDAKHRRDRIWIVGHDSLCGRNGTPQSDSENVANPDGIRQHRQRGVIKAIGSAQNSSRKAIDFVDSSGRAVWEPEPSVGRVAHGIPHRVDRLRGLGNAIVPQVAAEILRNMMAVDYMLSSGQTS